MKFAAFSLVLFLAVSGKPLLSQSPPPNPPARETVATQITGVVAGGTKVQVIKDGFHGTEGPISLPDGSLLFTETDANRILRINHDGKVSTFLENTNGSNGLAFDSKGRLISVQTVAGNTKVGVIYPKGQETVFADNYDGKPLSRPNDLVVDKKGGVYFTDNGPEPPNPPPPLPAAVYYIPPGGKIIRVTDAITRPNGIQLSRDERVLYVNDTRGEYMLAFDIQPDGTLRNRRNFAKYIGVLRTERGLASGGDGLAVDSEGRVYTTSNAGVDVFTEQGQHLGTIPVSKRPQNLAFAGPGKRTLYIVGQGGAYKVQMLSQGFLGRVK